MSLRKIPAFQKGDRIVHLIDDLDEFQPELEKDILDLLKTSPNDYFSLACIARKFNTGYGETEQIIFSMRDRGLCATDLINGQIYAILEQIDALEEWLDLRWTEIG